MNGQDRWVGVLAIVLAPIVAVLGIIYYRTHPAAEFNVFLGGIVTLGLYSMLYRENPIYRLFEHLFLGLTAGYLVVTAWTDVLSTQWYDPIVHQGKWLWLWVLPLAVMAYFVFSKRNGWISRIPLVILGGFAAGQMFQGFVSQYFPQIRNSFKSLKPTVMSLQNPAPSPDTLSISGAINNAIFMVTLLCVLVYFLFSFEQKNKGIRGMSRLGRWLIMIGFGAIFGSTIMTRFALLVDRMYFVLVEWLNIPRFLGTH